MKKWIAALLAALVLWLVPVIQASAIDINQSGPRYQLVTPSSAYPSTLAGSASWYSGMISMQGFRGITAAVILSQNGSISIQRYDPSGTIAVGSAISQAITAGTPATVSVNDGLPAAYFQVTISNSSGSSATVTNPSIIETGM